VLPYKTATMKLLLIPMDGALSVPDLRLLLGGAFMLVFLLVGWLRALRR